jgi:RNA polymerase sigma-70 factor (ECF subfamily)
MSSIDHQHSVHLLGDETDEALVAKIQKGNQRLFGVLIDRYQTKLMRYGKKFLNSHDDIQDIVQDVFIKAYQNLKSFDTSRRFSPWIYRIAHNACINELRKKSRQFISVDFDTFFPHPIYVDPDVSEKEKADMRHMLDKTLERLPPKYREVLVLHYYEDMAYKDIADILEVPMGTVSIRLKRAKESLKQLLHNHE